MKVSGEVVMPDAIWTTISCGFGAFGGGAMPELVPMMLSLNIAVLLEPSVTLAIVVVELE